MKALITYLDKTPKPVIRAICVMLVIIIGVIDNLTGYELSFSIFYLLPVALVAWFDKKGHAVIISIASAATWLLADRLSGHAYTNQAIPYWNSFVRFGFFLITAISLSEIKKLLENEQRSARSDFLTGVANSRAFYQSAKIEIERSARFNRPISIAYIDIDNFKHVNDTLGHSQGDNLLRSIAGTIKSNVRSIDIISRLGGDEFAVLLPETNEDNAKTALNKLQKELLSVAEDHNWPITFSIGTVTCYDSCNLDDLIKEADNLMYSVKKSGKNRIEYKTYRPASDGR